MKHNFCYYGGIILKLLTLLWGWNSSDNSLRTYFRNLVYGKDSIIITKCTGSFFKIRSSGLPIVIYVNIVCTYLFSVPQTFCNRSCAKYNSPQTNILAEQQRKMLRLETLQMLCWVIHSQLDQFIVCDIYWVIFFSENGYLGLLVLK